MPTASDELRAKMDGYFANGGIDDQAPYAYLIRMGYTEKAGMFSLPWPGHVVSEKEGDCLDFMCDEWDYGFEG